MLKPFLVVSNIYFSKLLGFIRIRSQYSRNDIIAYSQQCSLIHQEHIEVYKKDNYCKKGESPPCNSVAVYLAAI